MHDLGQLRKDIRVCLWRIRIPTHADLDHRQAEGPDIRSNGIRPQVILGFTLDPLGLQMNNQH